MAHLFFLWAVIALMTGALLYRKALSRNARLKHLAQRWGGEYCPFKSSLITQDNAAKLDFFARRAYSFHHIITQRQDGVFIRVADALQEQANGRARPLADLTVFSAEYFLGGWPAVKIAPRDGTPQRSHLTEVPAQDPAVKQAYHLFLSSPQAACLLTPALQHLLKRRADMYVEIYDNAMIYHEGQLLPPAEWDAFRLRAMQLLAALAPQHTPFVARPLPLTEETPDAQVQALLAAVSPRRYSPAPQEAGAFRLYKAVVLLLLLLLVPALIYFIVRHLPH